MATQKARLSRSLVRVSRGYRHFRDFLGRPRLQMWDRPAILDAQGYGANPFLVIGLHRSGTSHLRRIANAHGHFAFPPETLHPRQFAAMDDDEMTFRGLTDAVT
jgi:hypothetical protein